MFLSTLLKYHHLQKLARLPTGGVGKERAVVISSFDWPLVITHFDLMLDVMTSKMAHQSDRQPGLANEGSLKVISLKVTNRECCARAHKRAVIETMQGALIIRFLLHYSVRGALVQSKCFPVFCSATSCVRFSMCTLYVHSHRWVTLWKKVALHSLNMMQSYET